MFVWLGYLTDKGIVNLQQKFCAEILKGFAFGNIAKRVVDNQGYGGLWNPRQSLWQEPIEALEEPAAKSEFIRDGAGSEE